MNQTLPAFNSKDQMNVKLRICIGHLNEKMNGIAPPELYTSCITVLLTSYPSGVKIDLFVCFNCGLFLEELTP